MFKFTKTLTVVLGGLLFLTLAQTSHAATIYTKGLTINSPGTYENLDVSNPSGFCIKITVPNVILKNSNIHDCNGYGVWVESTHDVQIIGNKIWNTVLNTCYPNCSGGWESAIKVRSANQTDKLAYNILVENNLVYKNFGEGIATRGSKVTIKNNTFYDNFSVNIYSNGDNVTIDKNLVYCTGDTKFNRSGSVPVGIAQGDESYTGWNPSHARNLLVTNNIVTGCKFGFNYLGAESGVTDPGLKDSVIAFNTFACNAQTGIRLPYESGQRNVTIHNNFGATKISNMTGVSSVGNIVKSFPCKVYTPENFRLSAAVLAKGSYTVGTDYSGAIRTSPLDVGALEYGPTAVLSVTSTMSDNSIGIQTPKSYSFMDFFLSKIGFR